MPDWPAYFRALSWEQLLAAIDPVLEEARLACEYRPASIRTGIVITSEGRAVEVAAGTSEALAAG